VHRVVLEEDFALVRQGCALEEGDEVVEGLRVADKKEAGLAGVDG
jgi:hypothetical protein